MGEKGCPVRTIWGHLIIIHLQAKIKPSKRIEDENKYEFLETPNGVLQSDTRYQVFCDVMVSRRVDSDTA